MVHTAGTPKRQRTNSWKKRGRKHEKRVHTLADLDEMQESPNSVIIDAPRQMGEPIIRLSLMETGKGIQKRTRPDPIRLLHAARKLREELLAAGVELDLVKVRSRNNENGNEPDQDDGILKSASNEDDMEVLLEGDSLTDKEVGMNTKSWGRGRRLDSGKVI